MQTDVLVRNGKITTMSTDPGVPQEAEAIAIRDGRVHAAGSNAELDAAVRQGTRMIDAGGRRVIPGLIDSHIHFVRAGWTWHEEVRWEDIGSLAEGLERISERAASITDGQWIRVIGGWHQDQWPERRAPTREELDEVAPDNPVFVQSLYNWAQLNTPGMGSVGLDRALAQEIDPDAFDVGADGEPTGFARGLRALSQIYARLPKASFEDRVRSTAMLSRTLSQYGLTCVTDGGGVNTGPTVYPPVYECWRRGDLSLRVRLTMHGSGPGVEPEEIDGVRRYLTPRLGDDMLRVSGIGEVILFAIHDRLTHAGDLSQANLDECRLIFTTLAEARWPVQVHAHQPETIEAILEIWEEVHARFPIDDLRWSLVHGESLTSDMIRRLQALGCGVLLQALYILSVDDAIKGWGADALADAPPVRALLESGIPVGLGSDAMRAAPFNPFQTIGWFLDGRTADGRPTLAEHNLMSREEALRRYTIGSAWFTFDEDEIGSLEPGKRADLAILNKDYFKVPHSEIPSIRSWLTMVNGRVVWNADEVAGAHELR